MTGFNGGASTAKQQTARRRLVALAIAGAGVAAAATLSVHNNTVSAQKGSEIQSLGTISGTVTAPKAFKAAHVYLTNLDKHINYMVYTSGGNFRAVALFPGNYEVVVKGRGLESDVQKISIKSGENPALKVALKAGADPNAYPTITEPADSRTANGAKRGKRESLGVTYAEAYPPGPGLDVVENTCMRCHGENFFPGQQRSASGWKLGIEKMLGARLNEHDRQGLGEGVLGGATTHVQFGLEDRKNVLEYLTKNFGPAAKRRYIKTDVEVPLDEAVLGKAQYIEYYVLGGDETGEQKLTGAASIADSENEAGGVKGIKTVMQSQIDAQGNRWSVLRGLPSQLIKIDPRTGEQKIWDLPDKRAGVHEIILDRQGMVWVPEFSRTLDGHIDGMGTGSELDSRLLAFNPKTEKWEQVIDLDPNDVIRAKQKGPLMGATVASNGTICANWMLTGAIGCYDQNTKKAQTYRIPTAGAVPYGQTIDPQDNVWVAEWNGGKLGRFDPSTGAWTEFAPPLFPTNFRRGPNSDAQGNIWVGSWSAGKIPAKLWKLDPRTGKWQHWDLPHSGAMPYEASIDRDGNIWFPDLATEDHPIVIGKFDVKTQKFSFYPRPQYVPDSTRVNHAADGSVIYTARYNSAKDKSAFGSLFPDKDKITTLAPLMLNGAPGYPWKPGTTAKGNNQ